MSSSRGWNRASPQVDDFDDAHDHGDADDDAAIAQVEDPALLRRVYRQLRKAKRLPQVVEVVEQLLDELEYARKLAAARDSEDSKER
jgi:hypothetical protein